MCDVLLFVPNHKATELSGELDPIVERLGVSYIAAFLRDKSLTVEVLHLPLLGLDNTKTLEIVDALQPHLVGFSMMYSFTELESLATLAHLIKQAYPQIHVTVGGSSATLGDHDLLANFPAIDSIVRGEGENTIYELTSRLISGADWRQTVGISFYEDGKTVRTPNRVLIKDLDEVPFPARDFIDTMQTKHWNYQTALLATSRGCYGDCGFCCVRTFFKDNGVGPLWRARSAANVVEEMRRLHKDKGVRRFEFVDDNFIGPGKIGKKRAAEFAELLIASDMNITYEFSCRANDVDKDLFVRLKLSGLRRVFLGLESAVQRSLDLFNKKLSAEQHKTALEILREVDLDVQVGFIMFDPYTSVEEILENANFIHESGLETSFFRMINPLKIHVGTPISKKLKEQGIDLLPAFEPGTNFIHEYNYHFENASAAMVLQALVALRGAVERTRNALMRTAEDMHRQIAGDRMLADTQKFALSLLRELCSGIVSGESRFSDVGTCEAWLLSRWAEWEAQHVDSKEVNQTIVN